MMDFQMCGGSSTNISNDAPKTILSDKMYLFKVSSDMSVIAINNDQKCWFRYLSAFAVKIGEGAFVLLQISDYDTQNELVSAYTDYDVFPELVELVRKFDLARNNGYHHFVNGLPRNFGGNIDIRYESGEEISIGDNQSPVFYTDFALALYELLKNVIDNHKKELPDAQGIVKIIYNTEFDKSGFVRSELCENSDGTFTLHKQSRYDEASQVFEDRFFAKPELMSKFKETINNNYMLLWDRFPKSDYTIGDKKSLTFVFEDGSEVMIFSDRLLPNQFLNAFFSIELELNTCCRNHAIQ